MDSDQDKHFRQKTHTQQHNPEQPRLFPARFSVPRLLWLGAGLASVMLGLIGVIIPLLPTTVFMILAAFCFARSSAKLNTWLLEHRYFGPSIRHWQDHGAIPKSGKKAALLAMIIMLCIGYFIGVSLLMLSVQSLMFIAVLIFIWSRPSPPNS